MTDDGFIQRSQVFERHAEVGVRGGIVRLEGECPAVAGERLVGFPPVLNVLPRLL